MATTDLKSPTASIELRDAKLHHEAPLRAGWARVDITPPVGVPLAGYYVSEGRGACAVDVLDRLEAKALVLEDGATRVAIVSVDLIGIPEAFLARVTERIQAMTGIRPEAVVVAATHTHSGPTLGRLPEGPNLYPGQTHQAYVDTLVDDLASAVSLAIRRLQPASVAIGFGKSDINVNRREMLPDGSLRPLPFLGQNLDGPVDREVAVVRVDGANGQRLLLANYACHAVVLGPNVEISGDYPGAMQRFIETAGEGATMAMFTTGAHGDLNPIIHPGSYADAQRLGRILGAEVLRAAEQAVTITAPRITFTTQQVRLPTRSEPPLHEEAERLSAQLASALALREQRPLPTLIQEEMDYSVEMMSHLKRCAHPDGIPLNVTGIAIGPVALVTVPGELFNAVGRHVKTASPFETTVVVGLANGSNGYLPDRDAYAIGGFEVQATAFALGSAEAFGDHLLKVLETLASKGASA